MGWDGLEWEGLSTAKKLRWQYNTDTAKNPSPLPTKSRLLHLIVILLGLALGCLERLKGESCQARISTYVLCADYKLFLSF